jgi:hypothetical protein
MLNAYRQKKTTKWPPECVLILKFIYNYSLIALKNNTPIGTPNEVGFSNRKHIVGNHWKHWVLGNLVDFVNTKYRKHHRLLFNEFEIMPAINQLFFR